MPARCEQTVRSRSLSDSSLAAVTYHITYFAWVGRKCLNGAVAERAKKKSARGDSKKWTPFYLPPLCVSVCVCGKVSFVRDVTRRARVPELYTLLFVKNKTSSIGPISRVLIPFWDLAADVDRSAQIQEKGARAAITLQRRARGPILLFWHPLRDFSLPDVSLPKEFWLMRTPLDFRSFRVWRSCFWY